MPVQGPQGTDFLSCSVCFNVFDETHHHPISLGCGHTVCKDCLSHLQQSKCPFDQSLISNNIEDLPVNYALLQLVGGAIPESNMGASALADSEDARYYEYATKCIEELAVYLKPVTENDAVKSGLGSDDEVSSIKQRQAGLSGVNSTNNNCILSRPMQRKLVTLINCQLLEEEGRARATRAARSLGERTVTELILQHQNPQQLSANLWAAVRARGCQFLGPAMQEEVLKLILLALEDGSALSRKVLVLFVVQRLESQYPQASKTAIGHVVQLLYRASCFKVTKREEESSLMQLKDEFRTYEALRREHDSQIVQIAMEAGLRISPEQWSSLLYGDATHKSHMQSIIDKLQTPQSFSQSVSELVLALQRTGDPCNLQRLRPHLEFLSNIDPSPDVPAPSWENLEAVMKALKTVVQGLVEFLQSYSHKKHELAPPQNARYKTSMCRDLVQRGTCPRGTSCTFAHSQDELEKFRARSKKFNGKNVSSVPTFAALTPKEKAELAHITKSTNEKLDNRDAADSKSFQKENKQIHDVDKRKTPVPVAVSSMSSMTLTSPAEVTVQSNISLTTSTTSHGYSGMGLPGIPSVQDPYYHSHSGSHYNPTAMSGYAQSSLRSVMQPQYSGVQMRPPDPGVHMRYPTPSYVMYDNSVPVPPYMDPCTSHSQFTVSRDEAAYSPGSQVGQASGTYPAESYNHGNVPPVFLNQTYGSCIVYGIQPQTYHLHVTPSAAQLSIACPHSNNQDIVPVETASTDCYEEDSFSDQDDDV